jgi:hypothetical protein
MAGRREISIVGLACAAALLLCSAPASSLAPVASSEGVGLQHVALHALEETLRDGELYVETTEKSRLFTKDQMMGVLAAIAARSVRPDRAQFWEDRAKTLWEESEAAFLENSLYAGTLPAPSGVVCIDLLANSWALRAADALAKSGIAATPDPAERVEHLRGLLSTFLTGTTSAGKPLCPQASSSVPIHQRPLLYLALLETRGAPGPNIDGPLRNAIQSTIDESFDGAFALSDGLYLVAMNAQMLVVLTEASRVFDDAGFKTARADLAHWLQTEGLVDGPYGLEARNVIEQGADLERQAGAKPDGQIWLAYALSNLAAQAPELITPGVVASLLRAYPELFWSPDEGGFAEEDTVVYADYNLLPAVLTRSHPVSVNSLDPSTLAFVVPSLPGLDYPSPETEDGGILYIANQWTARLTIPPDATGKASVVIPAAELGPFNLSAPTSAFFPAPRLLRSGGTGTSEVPLALVAKDPNLLRFSPPGAEGQNAFRLDAYVPARPVFSDFGSNIRVVMENHGSAPLLVGTLQLEVEATQIRIRAASLDNLDIAAIEVIDPVITEQVPEPHMRVLLSDVTLPLGRSELVLSYTDIIRPEVGPPAITRDLEGRDVITRNDEDPVQVLQGETVFVRATVRDNGALRSVQLRYRTLDQSLDLRMSPVEGQADVYAAQLPTDGIPTGEGLLQVVAIDAAGTGNLNESAPLPIDLRDPLFAGSIVLFVFSGTLFLASFVIWLKVRRKALR